MVKYITCHRRGTATQWAEQNTIIPMEGEIVIEIDEINSLHKLKIGDGVHTYAELAYLQAGDEIVTQVLAEAKPRVVTVGLSEIWNQDMNGKYSQVISLDNITEHSRLDLQPDADMLAEFKQLGLVFVTENNGGTITVYSVGNTPMKSYTMQATIVETECDGQEVVLGIPVGVPVAQSDWAQTDDTKADYIKNKPTVLDGEDGLTPFIGENGNWWIGESDTNVKAAGIDGEDGVSVTHEWSGTVLTITSASGTSSVDLKGEKGEKGDKGDQGEPGKGAEITEDDVGDFLTVSPDGILHVVPTCTVPAGETRVEKVYLDGWSGGGETVIPVSCKATSVVSVAVENPSSIGDPQYATFTVNSEGKVIGTGDFYSAPCNLIVTYVTAETEKTLTGSGGGGDGGGGAEEITDRVSLTSYGSDQAVIKAVDNGNTVTILAQGDSSETSISIQGHNGKFVSGHMFGGQIDPGEGKIVGLITSPGTALSEMGNVQYNGCGVSSGNYGIVIHYV